ncbi:MAG: PBSX family phage terminase large subunit [Ruminococcus sp.]|nr:PBSX family phage terminase large subunit [Ruminococcus sp.]
MTFTKLSQKQKTVFKWCYKGDYNAIICDGAVRSGKTICMITSFILWAMKSFDGAVFGICGKTVRSAERNIVMPLQTIVDITAYFKVTYTRSVNMLTVEGMGRKNTFYVFGGKDESSYTLIQGITLSGVFFDEVALMPRSFVEQAVTRTLSVEKAKLWFNCNPDNQFHWFYTDWILKADERNALHLHFLMSDNPTLSPAQLERAEKQFTGVFHDRYIKGLWRAAEGIIYEQFTNNVADFVISAVPRDIMYTAIGFDFGGNGSAHAGVCTGFTPGLRRTIALEEYYRKEIISPSVLYDDMIAFILRCQEQFNVYDIYLDNAETTLIRGFKTEIAKRKIPINVHNARKYEILDRIRFTNLLMSQYRFSVTEKCPHLIEAFQSAVWDSKQQKDVRLDDGNYNIDSLDAFEYSVEKNMKKIIEIGGLSD